jgi:hypothetical protein
VAPKYYRSSDAGNIWCLFAQLLLAPVLPCLASPRFDWAPPFAFDDCSCGMLKSERIWFSGMHEPIPFIFLSKTFIYMVDSAPKDQGRSVTHLLEPYDSYLCEKIDFYIFGGDRIFFSDPVSRRKNIFGSHQSSKVSN